MPIRPDGGSEPLLLSSQLLSKQHAEPWRDGARGEDRVFEGRHDPVYNLATREDHIAPAKSVFHGCGLFGGEVTFVLSGSGHIAGVVNPPDKRKYQFWTGPKAEGALEDWLPQADEHPGSWWPHWHQWIEAQDATRVPARRTGGSMNTLEEAPGSYVRTRAS